jgi:uncharacterized protein
MAGELFVDTSGFYAILAERDSWHRAGLAALRQAKKDKRRIVTTDYVLDETATLLKARGVGRLVEGLFERVFASAACRVEWTDVERFHATRAFFQKHADHPWSFTDCLSFCVMKELRIRTALTSDQHFEQAGFVVLLK